MWEFLKMHPSVFIIGATVIIIILIFLVYKRDKSKYEYDITSEESTCSIEMQSMSPMTSSPIPDVVDSTRVPPSPKLFKLRQKLPRSNSSTPCDIPRLPQFNSISEYDELNEPSSSTSHLVEANQNGGDYALPVTPTVVYRKQNTNETNSDTENRMSVSDVHNIGKYVNFDDEFDHYDRFGEESNVMRISFAVEAAPSNYIVRQGHNQ